MKETPREQFRWAAHTGGLATARPKDYEPGEFVEAATPYAVWKQMLAQGWPLYPGDLLELALTDDSPGPLLIAKYIGFEPAQWYVPEQKPDPVAEASHPAPAVQNL
jgi:hypothetical protein